MLTTLEKAKALKEFRGLRVALTSGALKTLEKAKSLKRFRELRVLLGGDGKAPEGTKRRDDLIPLISKRFNGQTVSDVIVDDEHGNVSATVDGKKGIDAGFIEDYESSNQPKDFTPLLNSIINGDISVFDDSTKLTELVGAAQESGGDDMPDDKKDLFTEAIRAAGIQQLEGQGFELVN